MPSFGDCLGILRLVKVSIRVKRRWFVCETVTRKVFEETKSSDGTELVGCSGVLAPMKIFRGRQKLEKGAKDCITNEQQRRLSAEIQNLEKPKNSSTLLVVFASRK